MNDFKEVLTGGNSSGTLLAALIIGLLGGFLYLARDVSKGIKENYYSPEKFDFKYFVVNNLFRIVATPILVYLAALCGTKIYTLPAVEQVLTEYPILSVIQIVYFAIGFYADKFLAKL